MAEPSDARTRPRVAVTRSVADNRSLITAIEGIGAEPVAVPLVEVHPAGDGGDALRRALADLERYRWVVLTSVNGVRAVADAIGDRSWPPMTEVAVVGPATAEAARTVGLPVRLVPDEATAAALVEAFPPAPGGKESGDKQSGDKESGDKESGGAESRGAESEGARVLAPLAELAGPTIEDGLAARGWRVDRVEAYRTAAPEPAPTDPAVNGSGVAVVAFFSPSAVDRWVERFGSDGPAAVCVGPSTAARADDRGFRPVITAEPHTEAAVVEAVADELGSGRSGRESGPTT